MKYQVREKLFALGEDNDILNENGQPVLKVDGKVLSIHGLMLVNDLTGAEVGRVSRKLVALRATYEIALASGITAELHQRFTGPFHPKWNFSVSGGEEMEMSGNFSGHDFTLTANGQTIASVSKAWISLAELVWGRHPRRSERPPDPLRCPRPGGRAEPSPGARP